LTIDTWEDVKCELFWSFNDDVFTSWIPTNHMMVFGALKKTVDVLETRKDKERCIYA